MSQPPRPKLNEQSSDQRLYNAVRLSAAAALAGGIIGASGKPHSVDEAVKLMEEVRLAMRAARGRASASGQAPE